MRVSVKQGMQKNTHGVKIKNMSRIHTTAIIESGATLGKDVIIGPYCCIGSEVTLEDHVVLESHVAISGKTSIGSRTRIYPFTSIGHRPQDLKYKGEPSTLVIGRNNVIRENVTIQPGTEGGGMITKIGDDCLFMVGSHVAHDCQIGNHVILANNATLAGHVVVEDHVIIGGLCGIHQFVRIGAHAIIGGMSGLEHDVIPYGVVKGERAFLCGLNLIGLKRRNFEAATIQALREVYRTVFENSENSALTFMDRTKVAEEKFSQNQEVMRLIRFLQAESPRNLCLPKGL